ncbi:hypothetical protein VNO78_17212 [Psophocarpus tetragonolobus]|uniref:Uncharacterized protein n=1 Tax=Psophocarpus tetragonolobus TaxID=3891 RepID=A0AAN9SHK9_PSOTE
MWPTHTSDPTLPMAIFDLGERNAYPWLHFTLNSIHTPFSSIRLRESHSTRKNHAGQAQELQHKVGIFSSKLK